MFDFVVGRRDRELFLLVRKYGGYFGILFFFYVVFSSLFLETLYWLDIFFFSWI